MIPANAYNCSIIRFKGRLLLSYRHHDRKDGAWRTNLGICELDKDFCPIKCKAILAPQELIDNSHEDARIFVYQNALWLSWTISQWPTQEHRSIVAFGKLVEEQDCWKITAHYIPAFGINDFSSMEKNWLFFET